MRLVAATTRNRHQIGRDGLTPAVHSVICASHAGIAQLVERNLAKVEVASSSLVSRSSLCMTIRLPAASS